jgi:predicted signal transduction protein with EAL and GGDEF domain
MSMGARVVLPRVAQEGLEVLAHDLVEHRALGLVAPVREAPDGDSRHVARSGRSSCQAIGPVVSRPCLQACGDEFGVLLLRPGEQDIEWVAERTRRAVAAAQIEHEGRTVAVTASVGCAFASPRRGARNPRRMVIGADQAMYEARREGGNRTCIEAPPPSSVQL